MKFFPVFSFFLFFHFLTVESFLNFQSIRTDFVQLKKKTIRQSIDIIDDQIYILIEQRMNFIKKLKEVKKETKEDIIDPLREISILSRLVKKGSLDKEFVKNIWKLLFKESYKIQE